MQLEKEMRGRVKGVEMATSLARLGPRGRERERAEININSTVILVSVNIIMDVFASGDAKMNPPPKRKKGRERGSQLDDKLTKS